MAATPERVPWGRLLLATLVFTLLILTVTSARHRAGRTHYFDLGNQASLAHMASQGRFFRLNHEMRGNSRLPYTDIVTQLASPILWVWPSAAALQAVLSLALGGTLVTFFLLGRELWGSNRGGWFLALIYALHPSVHYWYLGAYQAHDMQVPALALGILGLVRGNPGLTFLGFVLTLAVRQEVALTVAWLGVLLMVFWPARRRYGAALTLASAAWFVIAMKVIIPPLQLGQVHDTMAGHYGHLGKNSAEVLTFLVLHPLETFQRCFSYSKLASVGLMLGGTGGPALFAPEILLVGLPYLGYSFLSQTKVLLHFRSHFWGVFFPFVMVATAIGFQRALDAWQRASPGEPREPRERILGAWCLLVTTTLLVGLHTVYPEERELFTPRAWAAHVTELQARLPPDDRLWVQLDMFPHFALREWTAPFPMEDSRVDEFDWILLAPRERMNAPYHLPWRPAPTSKGELVADINRLGAARARGFVIDWEKDGTVLLKRAPGGDHPETWARLQAIASSRPSP